MKPTTDYWIQALQLQPHIEGGAYARTYCADLIIPQNHLPQAFHGPRPAATAIYFLLQQDQFSSLHRIASDELWHFYYGDPLIIYEIDAEATLTEHVLGSNPMNKECFQYAVKAGNWFGAKLKPGGDYALVGCTVAPGFDFADFDLGARKTLLELYPQHAAIIKTLTR